jgi:uncharacterized protein YhdP
VLAGNTVRGNFQYVNLPEMVSVKSSDPVSIELTKLPSFSLTFDNLRYGQRRLQRVLLDVGPDQSGFAIRKFQIEDPYLRLNAYGDWRVQGKGQVTHLQGDVSSLRLSQALLQLGMNVTNLAANTANATFDLRWFDSPLALSTSRLAGNVSLQLGPGSILQLSRGSDAKLGLGRLLNLFSINSIPRRLNLDFSDLSQKGYSFDTIKADVRFLEGNAITNNLRIEGPVASVGMQGRIGLVARDLNLDLSIKPYFTSSLPVVAAMAGGPLVGVATFVVDKMVSRAVSNAITYRYHVTGSWDNPIWTQH